MVCKRVFIFCVFFIFNHLANAQTLRLGTPPIQNFDSKIYKAHNQNWIAVQDQRGVMYFGNSDGILEYDGVNWRHIENPLQTNTRSMVVSADGKIYYGSINDIGFLESSPNGRIKSVSLKDYIPEADRNFNDVWQAVSTPNNGIYFFTKERIFHLLKNKITVLNGKFATSQALALNDNIFYVDADNGLSVINHDHIEVLKEFSDIAQGRIMMAQLSDHEILVARDVGDLLKLDLTTLWNDKNKHYQSKGATSSRLAHTISGEVNSILKRDQSIPYRISRIAPKTYALATLKIGIVIFTSEGKIVRVINKNNGLIDNTVTNIFVDHFKNLWVSTNLGIAYIEHNTSQTTFGEANGLDGIMLTSIEYQNRRYVGNFQHLLVQAPFHFSMEELVPKFVPVKNTTGDVWHLLEVEGDLLATGSFGLKKIVGDVGYDVGKSIPNGYCLATSKKWPEHVFVGAMGGVYVYKRKNKEWNILGKMRGVEENILHITEDDDGDLWLSTETTGLLHSRFLNNLVTEPHLQKYDEKNGLPTQVGLHIQLVNGKLMVSSSKGVFRQIQNDTGKTIRFIPDPDLATFFNNPPIQIASITSDRKNGYFIASYKKIYWVSLNENGQFQLTLGAVQGVPTPDLPFLMDKMNTLWIPHVGLIRIDLSQSEKNYQQTYDVLIRQVITKDKAILFGGTYASKDADFNALSIFKNKSKNNQEVILPFEKNGLTFNFSATFYEKPSALQFRFKLDNFDDNWSEWGSYTTKEYTNIPSGTYAFKVQSRNVYGTNGTEAIYSFKILPPWYRTIWATLLWLLLGVGLLIGLVQFYIRKLKHEKMHLEQLVAQRTKELREASLTDPLTGLRNRRFISEILQNDMTAFINHKVYILKSKTKRSNTLDDEIFGVYLLDLDHFKQVNDVYGHEAGDKILKQISKVLMSLVREDDVAIRLGGEEFLIVLKKIQIQYLKLFAQKLLDAIAKTEFDLGNGIVIHKTCSIGYASYPFDQKLPNLISFEQTIELADQGMYFAKRNGRNRSFFVTTGENWPIPVDNIPKAISAFNDTLENKFFQLE